MVLTLHDLALASRVADRVVILSDGCIAADGSPAEVLTEKLLAEVYGLEAQVVSGEGGISITLLGRK